MSTNPPEGWFPDPDDASQQRYWDGSAWTESRRPPTPSEPATPAPGGPYGSPYGAAPAGPVPNAGGAVASLVLGILSLACCGLVTGIPAMIMARRATREVDASQGRLGGRGIATAGFVTGLIGTLLTTFALVVVVFTYALGSTLESTFDETCTSVDGTTTTDC